MDSGAIEEKLLEQYGGKGNGLPQTLVFDHVSPATRLLEKRRQMFEVQEALNSQKEEFARREDAFRRREEALRRKDIELQESLIKFNKFLQENESKKNRAMKRSADEKKQREQKEQEIIKLERQLKEKLQEEQALKIKAERHMKYHDYLENVVTHMSKFFPEISDVLNRHRTLKEVNLYLLDKNEREIETNENTQRDFSSYRKVKENELLNCNNDIAVMQVKLEQRKNKSTELQSVLDRTTQEAARKTLALGQIISSVKNILNRCEESFRNRHNKPKIDRASDKTDNMLLQEQFQRTMSKLDEIGLFMVDYRDIIDEYQAEFGKRGGGGGGGNYHSGASSGHLQQGSMAAQSADGKKSADGGDSKYFD